MHGKGAPSRACKRTLPGNPSKKANTPSAGRGGHARSSATMRSSCNCARLPTTWQSSCATSNCPWKWPTGRSPARNSSRQNRVPAPSATPAQSPSNWPRWPHSPDGAHHPRRHPPFTRATAMHMRAWTIQHIWQRGTSGRGLPDLGGCRDRG